MKFIHIADVHLGAEPDQGCPWGEGRDREIWDSFRRVIQRTKEEQADLLLIAGDLFHRQPLLRELKEVNSLFASLPSTHVVLIAGNHDYIRADSYYRNYRWCPQVNFLGDENITGVSFPRIHTRVYGFSYHSQEIYEHRLDSVHPDDTDEFHILLGHGGDRNHVPIRKDLAQSSGFDYIALGHIHKPGIEASGRMAYAGVLEPSDRNDTGAHGFIIGEVQKGHLTLRFIPSAKREYVHQVIPVTPEDTFETVRSYIERHIETTGKDHIYKFILRGHRDPNILLELPELENLGNIICVEDETTPDLDMDALKQEHKNDLVGRYIRHFQSLPDSQLHRDALDYGIQALLHARR